ncbi:unnamed protein product [Rotaria sp. Silwood1]|nr:unnamed protein product [Rotaria sp. Silwood1]CAF1618521.1 unnamed protein product [Rotaria sp. Silwood1]CAF3825232.1 unnamed protein product [Rotaria sp. Silwood1]CAF4783339.1 unnamed protein product [Rotaria sp. Silwood1]
MSNSSLDILPVEILHHILDNLDIQTILFSFRYVCKRFDLITNSYNYFNFNFESISKTKFLRICHMIPFEQVVSLTLSDKDKTHGQIQLFISLFDINQFLRLRSLKLIRIESNHLKIFLDYTIHSSLISLSIDSQTLNIGKNPVLTLLSSTIEHYTLQKLDLNIWPKNMKEFQWPINCTIKYLSIKNSITLNQFYIILEYSPCLQTIILKDFNANDTDENISIDVNQTPFLQLKSLTCEGGRIQMNKLELCLSLTPALIYLKLIGSGNLFNSSFDGYRWEQLIKTKLPLLEKFDFFISVFTHVNFDTNYIEQIISLYQTSFWLDEKHCLVICDYIIYIHKLILYSLPICNLHFVYHSEKSKVSASNFTINNHDPMMMDNVKQLDIHLSKVMDSDEIENINYLQFRNVTELTLGIADEWPENSFRFLSTTINLFNIVKLSLSINFSYEYMPSIVHSIKKLLIYAHNINILSLFDYWASNDYTTSIETIYSMITPNIKHLHIRVKNSDDIKFIIENFKHLKSVTFEHAQNLILTNSKFIEYLPVMKRHVSRWESQYTLHVWLDNN